MPDTIVWITGASSGIGAALVRTCPFDDAHIVDISRTGGTPGAEHLPADLSEPSAWSAVEAHLLAQLGAFTGKRAVLIHSAGLIEPIGFAGQVNSEAYRRNILVNAAAGQALGHAFLRALLAAGFDGESHLLMLSSGAATNPYPGWSSYCAGKAALEMWVRTVGAEQQTAPPGCRVVAVAPGVVATRMQEQIRASEETDFPSVEKFHRLHAEGGLREPGDAAAGIWATLDRDLDSGAVVDLRTA
jgi:benzil reductase ((S)-benzoin forming)